jgi:RNA polymerase sigma factor (sigma-70 family)
VPEIQHIEDLLRELAPQVLGVLVRRYGDFDTAEDAVQEALLSAAVHWPKEGTPDNPRGWLIQTGTRKLLDQVRGERARRRRESAAALREPPPVAAAEAQDHEAQDHDDTLTLLFMCCHPALTPASAIALTLRALGGLTTAEIASAFLVPDATMAQRISRAKQRIKASQVPLRMPAGSGRPRAQRSGARGQAAGTWRHTEWKQRLGSVLHVLYLIFNEGYASSTGDDLHRVELSDEAIRLTRTVHRILPDDSEVAGLLALMLLTDARRPARTGAGGELIPLAEQDRSRWDRALIAEGTALLDRAVAKGAVGEYQLQAAIAALHDRAARVEDTDWPQILALYGLLEEMTGSPVVALNRAIAAAMVHGPAEGLRLLATLDERLPGHHRLAAVRAHLLETAGELDQAVAQYRAAASRTTSTPEKHYLTTRAARLRAELDASRQGSTTGPEP